MVALWGLWDLYDVEVNNVWLRVGTPAWSRHMEGLINRAVDVLTARGTVVILTTPYTLSVARWRGPTRSTRRSVRSPRRGPKQLTVVDIQNASDVLHPTRWDTVHYTSSGADVFGGAVVPALAHLLPAGHTVAAPLASAALTRRDASPAHPQH